MTRYPQFAGSAEAAQTAAGRTARRILIAFVGFIALANPAFAQYQLEVVHAFQGGDGITPLSSLLETSDGSLYGTTQGGGAGGTGVVFRILPDRSFVHYDLALSTSGANPRAALILGSDGLFYGTTEHGGANSSGTYFRMTPAGAFTTFDLPNFPAVFCGSAPAPGPTAPLALAADGNLYGMTGGPVVISNCTFGWAGALVRLSPQGTMTRSGVGQNNRAAGALAVGADGRMYGTAAPIFFPPHLMAFATDTGGTFAQLHNFAVTESGGQTLLPGPDGNFYSTLTVGGAAGKGIVYRMTPGGSVTTLHEFQGPDGDSPSAGLVRSRDGFFYGVTSKGGQFGDGAIFRVSATGDFSVVYSFTGGADGSDPEAALIESRDGSLYGTAAKGGSSGVGVVFRIKSVAPAPFIAIDVPAAGATAAPGFEIDGWTADFGAFTGTGTDAVHVYAYPNPGSGTAPVFLGVATLGGARNDIGAIFGTQFTASGFTLTTPPLAAGPYLLVTFAHSAVTGTFAAVATRSVTVVAPQSIPAMALDIPASGASVTGQLTVSGWAVDLGSASGSGVAAVHIWAFPNGGGAPQFLGVAGTVARPDVGAIFGSRFTNCGYQLQVTVPPGAYTIAALAYSTVTNTFNDVRVATNVTVK
jgi:uncharacterized repeat protein (TIGR03803 family)